MESLAMKLGGRALSDVRRSSTTRHGRPGSQVVEGGGAKLGTKILSEEEFFQKVE
jgi:hypothetical protein